MTDGRTDPNIELLVRDLKTGIFSSMRTLSLLFIKNPTTDQIRCVVFNGIGNYLEVGTPQKFTFSP